MIILQWNFQSKHHQQTLDFVLTEFQVISLSTSRVDVYAFSRCKLRDNLCT